MSRTALLLAEGAAFSRVFGDDGGDHGHDGDDACELHVEDMACLRGLVRDDG
jgi:hypothetical protein